MRPRPRSPGARLLLLLLLVGSALALAPATAQERSAEQEEPTYGRTPADLVPYRRGIPVYRSFYLTPPLYRGPGRLLPEPRPLAAVRIGLLAPRDPEVAGGAGVALLRGVLLAMEQANASGGYGGLPFEIVEADDGQLWGSSANALVRLAWEDNVWAVIGSPDSTSAHVALRVALKAEVPIVNVGAADPTLTETGIPWIVRCTPDDRQTGYRLASLLFDQEGIGRVAVIRSSDRYGRAGVKEFRDAARRLGRPVPVEILIEPQSSDLDYALERVQSAGVDAIVLWMGAEDGARVVTQLRARGMRQRLVGTDRLATDHFLERAGAAAEGLSATAWAWPAAHDLQWKRFRDAYQERFEIEPDLVAAYGYDAAGLVVDAVRRAGLNRARIRDVLADARQVDGVAGQMQFDATSNNVAPLELLTVRDGRFVPHRETAAGAGAGAAAGETGVQRAEPRPDESGAGTDSAARSEVRETLRVGLVLEPQSEAAGLLAGALRAANELNTVNPAGRAIELLPVRPGGPWDDTGSQVARLAAEGRVAALVGATSGAAAHVTAQIATRLRVPALVLSPEDSLTRAFDPWVFRAVASDRRQAEALLRMAWSEPTGRRVVAVVGDGREGRERLVALREAGAAVGVKVLGATRTSPLPKGAADGLLLWLDADEAAAYLGVHTADLPATVLGSTRLFAPAVVDAVRDSGVAVLVPVPVATAAAAAQAVRDLRAGGGGAERVGYELVRLLHQAGTGDTDAGGLRAGLVASVNADGELAFDPQGNRRGSISVLRVAPEGLDLVTLPDAGRSAGR